MLTPVQRHLEAFVRLPGVSWSLADAYTVSRESVPKGGWVPLYYVSTRFVLLTEYYSQLSAKFPGVLGGTLRNQCYHELAPVFLVSVGTSSVLKAS